MPNAILTRRREQFRKLGILVKGAIAQERKDAEAVGKLMGKSRSVAYRYIQNPEELPLDRLLALCKGLGVPIEEFRDCIRY